MKGHNGGHKTVSKNFKKIEITQNIFSDHSRVNLEIIITNKLEESPKYLEIKPCNN